MSPLTMLLVMYILLDVNYFLRCLCIVVQMTLTKENRSIIDSCMVYGICTPQDSDIFMWHMNNARFLRELNFASLHFYLATGLYGVVKQQGGKIVQRATTLRYRRYIPIFCPYKVQTRLVWWDAKSIYLEQQFITYFGGFVNAIVYSKQHMANCNVIALMQKFPAVKYRPPLPHDLKLWLLSMAASSKKMNPSYLEADESFFDARDSF